jgi:osmoprotectant transport system substrate-binding protein
MTPIRTTKPGGRRSLMTGLLAAAAALTLASCGGSSDVFEGSSSQASGTAGSAGASKGTLTVGGANFTEMLIMQQMYGQLLTKAGYTVDYVAADNREIYAVSLSKGEIDVVPEYAATMAEFLNRQANGPDATAIATADAAATVSAMRPLAEGQGLTVLEPAKAADQNGFAVTKTFSTEKKVTTLSQLAALGQPVTLAGTPECADRPFCAPGLTKTYGLKIAKVEPLGFGTPQAKQAVVDGKADLVLVGTTDGTLDQLGLTLLQDDKTLQLADNLVPVVNTRSAGGAEIAEILNKLSAVLTTEDLRALNLAVDGQRLKPVDVAADYLKSKALL